MSKQLLRTRLLAMCAVILICGSPSRADDSSDALSGVLGSLMLADLPVTMFNGFLWVTHREWAALGWTGIALGGSTVVLSAASPLWLDTDDPYWAAGPLMGLAIGGVTTALGVVTKHHADGNRQRQRARSTLMAPSVFRDAGGELATGVMVRIGF